VARLSGPRRRRRFKLPDPRRRWDTGEVTAVGQPPTSVGFQSVTWTAGRRAAGGHAAGAGQQRLRGLGRAGEAPQRPRRRRAPLAAQRAQVPQVLDALVPGDDLDALIATIAGQLDDRG
jgi:hypothetical protein